jgi:hypothetical protein
MSDNTLTVWEIDKEMTIAAFAGYLTFGNPFEGEHRAMAEDLFAEIQGREIELRRQNVCVGEDYDCGMETLDVWVEVDDGRHFIGETDDMGVVPDV